MMSNALEYASRLKKNDNKGPLGQAELIDSAAQVSRKTQALYELLKSARNTVVHTGAGTSTGSGIPDFRGPTGIWTIMSTENAENLIYEDEGKRKKDDPIKTKRGRRKLVDSSCIPTNKPTTRNSSRGNQEDEEKDSGDYVRYGNNKTKIVDFALALPNVGQLVILELLRKGVIKHIITQNIDGLHPTSGVEFDKLCELHGNLFVQRCCNCGRRYQRSYVSPTISFNYTGELCGLCSFPPLHLMTDVVLDWFDSYETYYEDLAQEKAQEADLHVSLGMFFCLKILGSSLQIQPACHYASEAYYRSDLAPLVIVNYQNTKLDAESDLIIHEDVNKVLVGVLQKFGWELPPYIKRGYLVAVKFWSKCSNIVILRMPHIKNVEVLCESSSETESDSPEKTKTPYKMTLVNKLLGIYKIIYRQEVELVLTLDYNCKVNISLKLEPSKQFKAEVWGLDLISVNYGSSSSVAGSNAQEDPYDAILNITNMEVGFKSDIKPYRLVAFMDIQKRLNSDKNKQSGFTSFKLRDSIGVFLNLWLGSHVQATQIIPPYRLMNYFKDNYCPLDSTDIFKFFSDFILGRRNSHKSNSSKNQDITSGCVKSDFKIKKEAPDDFETTLSDPSFLNKLICSYNSQLFSIPNVSVCYTPNSHKNDSYEPNYSQDIRSPNSLLDNWKNSLSPIKKSVNHETQNKNALNTPKLPYYKVPPNIESLKEFNNKVGRRRRSRSWITKTLSSFMKQDEANEMKFLQGIQKLVGASTMNRSEFGDENNVLFNYYDNHMTYTKATHTNPNDETSDNEDLSKHKDKEKKFMQQLEEEAKQSNESKSSRTVNDEKFYKILKYMFHGSKFNHIVFKHVIDRGLLIIPSKPVCSHTQQLNYHGYSQVLNKCIKPTLYIRNGFKLGKLTWDIPTTLLESTHKKQKDYTSLFNRFYRYSSLQNLKLGTKCPFTYPNYNPDGDLHPACCSHDDEHGLTYYTELSNIFELCVFSILSNCQTNTRTDSYLMLQMFYHLLPMWVLKYLGDLFECR